MLSSILNEMNALGNPEKAKAYAKFFKTGKGEYGEGDVFLGISVPQQRKIAKKYKDIPLSELQKLLKSNIHEHRFTALIILTLMYSADNKNIFAFYVKNKMYINSWDLVDVTAPKIIGEYLFGKDKSLLYRLANGSLWERRLAIISTFAFIRRNDFTDALKISEILLDDEHDLIHKAVGWTLREIGKKDMKAEETFLQKHFKKMPRTMLRYSIEKFPAKKRTYYMGR